MKDSRGNELSVGDQFACKRGLYKVTMMNGPDYMMANNGPHGFGYDQRTFSREFPDAVKVSYHNVPEQDLSDIRNSMGFLITRTSMAIRDANPTAHVVERERMVRDLLLTLLLEAE